MTDQDHEAAVEAFLTTTDPARRQQVEALFPVHHDGVVEHPLPDADLVPAPAPHTPPIEQPGLSFDHHNLPPGLSPMQRILFIRADMILRQHYEPQRTRSAVARQVIPSLQLPKTRKGLDYRGARTATSGSFRRSSPNQGEGHVANPPT